MLLDFSRRNLRKLIISWSVNPWQALSAKYRPGAYPRVDHLNHFRLFLNYDSKKLYKNWRRLEENIKMKKKVSKCSRKQIFLLPLIINAQVNEQNDIKEVQKRLDLMAAAQGLKVEPRRLVFTNVFRMIFA